MLSYWRLAKRSGRIPDIIICVTHFSHRLRIKLKMALRCLWTNHNGATKVSSRGEQSQSFFPISKSHLLKKDNKLLVSRMFILRKDENTKGPISKCMFEIFKQHSLFAGEDCIHTHTSVFAIRQLSCCFIKQLDLKPIHHQFKIFLICVI